MDVIRILQNEHHSLGELFSAYEGGNLELKESLAWRLLQALSTHGAVEHTAVYRLIRDRSPVLESLVSRGAESHHLIATTLTDLERLLAKPGSPLRGERIDAVVETLRGQFSSHVAHEDTLLFPAMRRAIANSELQSMGTLLANRASSVIHLNDGSTSAG